jgi:hypothetical protein
MNRKFLGIVIATLLVLGVMGQSQAGVAPANIGEWKGLTNGYLDQDKLYRLTETDLADATPISFSTILFPSYDLHSLTVTAPVNTSLPSAVLEYTISIIDSPFYFETVSLGIDALGRVDQEVTKQVYDGGDLLFTLTSTNGNDVPPVIVPRLLKTLRIVDTLTVGPDGALQSVTNSFTQAVRVPEPASIVSFGGLALLMGFVMMRRRKRA